VNRITPEYKVLYLWIKLSEKHWIRCLWQNVAKTFAPQTKADVPKMTEQIEREMERDIKDLQ
jgi:hypothetical protein